MRGKGRSTGNPPIPGYLQKALLLVFQPPLGFGTDDDAGLPADCRPQMHPRFIHIVYYLKELVVSFGFREGEGSARATQISAFPILSSPSYMASSVGNWTKNALYCLGISLMSFDEGGFPGSVVNSTF